MIPTVTNPLGISPAYGRRLQYIASTGTQYINTGVKPDFAGGDEIEVKFYKGPFGSAASTGICLFGCRQGSTTNGFYVLGTYIVYSDNEGYDSISFGDLGTFTFTADDQYIKFGNSINEMTKRVTCTYDMFLFALNNIGTPLDYYPDMRLYSWKYWHNGTLAQHLVPVLDKSGVPCLYDTVTQTLKYNAGTGTFNYA